jgi:hypothetical protein
VGGFCCGCDAERDLKGFGSSPFLGRGKGISQGLLANGRQPALDYDDHTRD